MIDLDVILQRWTDSQPWESPLPGWNEEGAHEIARQVAGFYKLRINWDPPDEEWIRVLSDELAYAMVSTLFPLAIATRVVHQAFAAAAPQLVVVEVSHLQADELRASPEVLRATLLRFGWSDDDFNTDAFCAGDLFVESV